MCFNLNHKYGPRSSGREESQGQSHLRKCLWAPLPVRCLLLPSCWRPPELICVISLVCLFPSFWCWCDAADWKERKQGSEKMNDKQKSDLRCWSLEPPASVQKLRHCLLNPFILKQPRHPAWPFFTWRKTFCNQNKPLPPQQGWDWTSARFPARGTTPVRGDGSGKELTDSGAQWGWSGS